MQSGHHLLHKYILRFILEEYNHGYFDAESISVGSYNPLTAFIRFNLIISVLNLIVVWIILEQRKWRHSSIALALLFLSATFSFMKYSFENETYMLPLFFSLLGTYFYEKKQWMISFLLLSTATLFHQSHIFWLLALWLHLKNRWSSKLVILSISTFYILTTYYFFSVEYSQSLPNLIFQDVESGLVQLVPSMNNATLTAVNFFRVFFQVHGELIMFWKVFNPFLSGVAIISILFTLIGIVLYIGAHQLHFKKSDWSLIYMTAFLFHFLFAAYSVGNIEFMIVLPFLLVLSHKTGRIMNYSLLVSLGMFLWNFGQFALPRISISPNRLHQKLSLISSIKPSSDSILVCIEDTDLHQNYFEYQLLTRKSKITIKCIEPNSPTKSNLTVLHQKSRFSRQRLTQKSSEPAFISKQNTYLDSSVMGNITIITN
jgi:hypothetical protein